MLFLLLALLSLSLTRIGRRPKIGVVAGVTMTLAVLTKQSALIIFVLLALYSVVYKRRFGMTFIATTLGLSSASMALLTLSSDGWVLYYLIKLPLKHQTVHKRLLTFWTQDLLSPFPLVIAFALGAVVLAYRDGDSETSHFYTLALIGFLGASWQARLHKGAGRIPSFQRTRYSRLAADLAWISVSLTSRDSYNRSTCQYCHPASVGRCSWCSFCSNSSRWCMCQWPTFRQQTTVPTPDRLLTCMSQWIHPYSHRCIRTWLLKPDMGQLHIQWPSSISYRPLRTPNSKHFGAISVTR